MQRDCERSNIMNIEMTLYYWGQVYSDVNTPKRNKNATRCQWKNNRLLFKV